MKVLEKVAGVFFLLFSGVFGLLGVVGFLFSSETPIAVRWTIAAIFGTLTWVLYWIGRRFWSRPRDSDFFPPVGLYLSSALFLAMGSFALIYGKVWSGSLVMLFLGGQVFLLARERSKAQKSG